MLLLRLLICEEVGLLDDDITTRFHIMIGLRPLGFSDQLSMWRTFIRVLTRTRHDIEVEEHCLEYLEKYTEEYISTIQWNARQIQNGISHLS